MLTATTPIPIRLGHLFWWMIDAATGKKILLLTRDYWEKEVRTEEFARIAAGKEIGHRIADLVDERTVELLRKHFTTQFELHATGKARPRSMGDVWLQSQGMFNPVNVKTGAGKSGQPNMVSLKKVLRALLARYIDSYYLLIVKLDISKEILCSVYFIDMLDYLEFMTFDSGPGQIMLKERQFYAAVDGGYVAPPRTVAAKVAALLAMLEDAETRLIDNRLRVLTMLRAAVKKYASEDGHVVNQSRLRLK